VMVSVSQLWAGLDGVCTGQTVMDSTCSGRTAAGRRTMQAAMAVKDTPYARFMRKAGATLSCCSTRWAMVELRNLISVETPLLRPTQTNPVRMPVKIITRFLARVKPE